MGSLEYILKDGEFKYQDYFSNHNSIRASDKNICRGEVANYFIARGYMEPLNFNLMTMLMPYKEAAKAIYEGSK